MQTNLFDGIFQKKDGKKNKLQKKQNKNKKFTNSPKATRHDQKKEFKSIFCEQCQDHFHHIHL
jgi:hypothetical protein